MLLIPQPLRDSKTLPEESCSVLMVTFLFVNTNIPAFLKLSRSPKRVKTIDFLKRRKKESKI